MSDLQGYDDGAEQLHLYTEGETARSSAVKLGAALCALLLTATLVFGFLYLRKRNKDQLNAAQRAEAAARALAPPRAQVFQDEVRLKGSQALVGGTVRNISGSGLEDLSVEILLKRRATQAAEARTVSVVPEDLRPGEEGKYALEISPQEWSGAQVVRLRSRAQSADIPFKPELGERRPLEKPPPGKVVVEPRPRRKGDDFLNTPDTPIRIP